MRFLKEVRVAIVMTRICVIVENFEALVESVDWEEDQNFLPLHRRQLVTEKWNEIPKNRSDCCKCD